MRAEIARVIPMTITLPSSYPADALDAYAADLLAFLSSPHIQSIFAYHPNYVALHGPQPEWIDWWAWAAAGPRRWETVVDTLLNDTQSPSDPLPSSLCDLIREAKRLALPRESGERRIDPLRDGNGRLPVGMKPKKAHEVRRMSAFVGDQVRSSSATTRRIVDVGAGQVRTRDHL